MMKTSLTRSVPYLLLLLLSLIAIGAGGWLATRQIDTMTAALLGGTATGVEVYGGQSWVMLGAALVGSGVVGLLLALALAAAKTLIPRSQAEAAAAAPQEVTVVDDEADVDGLEEAPVGEPVDAAPVR